MNSAGKILCIGYGYTAGFTAKRLQAGGWTVSATARSQEKAALLDADGVMPVLWAKDGFFSPDIFRDQDAILITTPPDANGCPAHAAATRAIAQTAARLRWIGYLSSNGVYGDHDGAWVDEGSETKPSTDRGRRRLAAEDQWRDFADLHDLPLVIFRLPGVYGPGRSALDTVRSGKARRIIKPGQLFNRMHVDDIAAALVKSLMATRYCNLYNLSDDEPSPPQDVVDYACALLDAAPPDRVKLADADLSPMGRSFYAENKRVSNKRMKETLGVKLQYPTYREGLDAIFKDTTLKERG